jgi:Tfp pilus assembly protein PilX
MDKNIIKNQEGMVLILVLVVLVAAIITGISIMRTSTLETKIAGNERIYAQNVYELESATAYAVITHTTAISSVATSTGASYTYPKDLLPDTIYNTNLSMELVAIKKPPLGKGIDPSLFKARYYRINASEDSGSQTLQVGTWKTFPVQQDQ